MKRIFSILIILLVALSVQSQRIWASPEHYLGVRGGLSMSMVMLNPSVSQGFKYSYVAGGVYRMQSEKYFGIQAELNYAQRGWQDDVGYARTLGYLEVPFLTHITFGSRLFKFFINLGPSVSLMVNDEGRYEGSSQPQESMQIDNRFDYSIMGGLGFEFHTKAGVWTAEGRYSFGLGDIFSSGVTDYFKLSSNQNIYVTVGWMFNVN